MRRQHWLKFTVSTALMVAAILSSGITRAASWADGLFSESNHDFGPVPRGAKVHHEFVLTNRFNEPVTILDVRASCGCTTGRASASVVPPGGAATVAAEMDTRNFVGRKATVLFVSVVTASGKQAEARLGVVSTILSDIVFNPGTIDFGAVSRGQPASQTLTIDRVGLPSWRVERMISGCGAIDASLVETVRDGQRVGYTLTVAIKPDAPAGQVRDEIRLVTNDRETSVLPVRVSALIRGDLTASPSVLALGRVASASGVEGKFLVRASHPFAVKTIEGSGEGFQASVDDASAKPVHLITVNYHPQPSLIRGDVRRVFRVHTDLAGENPLDLTTTLHVDP